MNNVFNELLSTPPAMIVVASVLVVLIAATMYSVIKRERVMTGERRYNSAANVAYMAEWRNRTSA